MSRSVAEHIRRAFGDGVRVQVVARGDCAGPADAEVRLVINEEGLAHLVRHPGELGFARGYVGGSIEVEGDLFSLLRARAAGMQVRVSPTGIVALLAAAGPDPWRRHAPVPAQEAPAHGRLGRHRKARDKRAISHHYDVGNEFYELLLGPSMVYSCAVFEHPGDTLEAAQWNKLELICRKLGLQDGMHLLDVGCGWGSLVLHAAREHGVHATGITLSEEQARYARRRVEAAGLDGRVSIELRDYRDLGRRRFDAISSVGMSEHVGRANLAPYFTILHDALEERGRLLNHQIGHGHDPRRPTGRRTSRLHPDGFMHRYVFPDGELHEIGELVAVMQECDLEVRHLESLREHYGLTTRRWLANLEQHWDEAVALAGEGRARVWRLYLAGSAVGFETGSNQVHQVLAVRTPVSGAARGDSGVALRPVVDLPLREGTFVPDPMPKSQHAAPMR